MATCIHQTSLSEMLGWRAGIFSQEIRDRLEKIYSPSLPLISLEVIRANILTLSCTSVEPILVLATQDDRAIYRADEQLIWVKNSSMTQLCIASFPA